MSRIGQKLIDVPAGVTLTIDGTQATVVGPRGTMGRMIDPAIQVLIDGNKIQVTPVRRDRQSKPLHGLYRQLLANMITGVTTGFTKGLEMKGTGYRAEVQGNDLVLSVGFSHPVRITAPQGVTFKVEKNVQITIEGNDKEVVGEIAAKIRAVRKPEPYKGKGIRYAGEMIRLKPGKAAKSGA